MEKNKMKLPKLEMAEIPNLRSVIDYCSLHETTGEENYRKLAIDKFRMYDEMIWFYNLFTPEMINEFSPLIAKEMDIDDGEYLDKEDMILKIKGISQKLSDCEAIQDWRNYCLGCKIVDPKNCKKEREKLVAFQKNQRKNIENIVKDSIKIGRLIIEHYYI